jgi:Amt family ammonium transporter
MYRAKERGHGRLEVFDERMRAQATARLRIETELRHALERDELRLHYQPIVDMEDGRVNSFEALVRWQHPERGLLAPGEFIPVAEQSEAIIAIGEWVFEEACRQSVAWAAEHPDRPPVPISVNLSARHVLMPDVVDRLAGIVERTGADPRLMRAEITESALMEDAATTVATLKQMKELGIELMLDDFGTGYSSLAYVNRFPIDVLKIDRSFVAALDRGEDAHAIVEAIISMARGLRVDVIAEGVEHAEQAEILRALGCRHVQGFLYAQPMPPEDAVGLLDAVLTPA